MIPKPGKKVNWKKRCWDAFSLMIRTQVGYCEFHKKLEETGIPAPCNCNGVLQACHKITRAKNSILFDRRNVICGCSGSNAWSHFHEPEWDRLWRVLWPEDVEYLEERKGFSLHRKAWDYKLLMDEFKLKTSECIK